MTGPPHPSDTHERNEPGSLVRRQARGSGRRTPRSQEGRPGEGRGAARMMVGRTDAELMARRMAGSPFMADFRPEAGFQELLRRFGGGGALKQLRDAKRLGTRMEWEAAERERFKQDVERLNERLREQGRGLINPHGTFVQYWDMISTAALLYTMFVTPFEVGLNLPTAFNGLFVCNIIIGLIFFADVLVQFVLPQPLRGSQARGESAYERRHYKLARHYLLGWFTIDVVTIIPFDILVWQGLFSGEVKLIKILRVLRLLKVVKVLRAVSRRRRRRRHRREPIAPAHPAPATGVRSPAHPPARPPRVAVVDYSAMGELVRNPVDQADARRLRLWHAAAPPLVLVPLVPAGHSLHAVARAAPGAPRSRACHADGSARRLHRLRGPRSRDVGHL